ncbi:hypothetical protein DMH15_10695 [Streptomyces sp. WAC 06725]|uniref:DUF6461 domain-containing protein n=1 Tax=Streptomyces sp. WAC 06725 TaxID=2203209 RepID=UPI000F7447EE|nr:DUF6461 domain-containing protein [Streptomyces sp. WAC 06725]RSO43158.1 hypothetical protein DMH15_10695 [Streptomyces sp. WAC 06725]
MNNSTPDPWGWAQDPNAVMWCLTFTHGITPHDVLSRYGADHRAAQLLNRQQAAALNEDSPPDGSVLRSGSLGEWSFCFEDYGVVGAMPGPLSALSRGTETFSVLLGGDGMNGFAHWRDSECTEQFEPGFSHTKPNPPHPWWDIVQGRLDASGEEYPGLVPVLEAITHHTGAVLDTRILHGPLLTLWLDDTSRTPDPTPRPHPHRAAIQQLGRPLGSFVLPPTDT